MDMASICRLCLNEEPKLIDLFSDKDSSERIQKIYEISNILMTPEPESGCPNGVCDNCNRQLEISWKFRKQIQNSNIIITDTLQISIEPSCSDEIMLAENVDKVENDVSDKEIDDEDVFFEIEEVESDDIDEPTNLPGSSEQTDNRLHCEMCKRMHKCDKCDARFLDLGNLKIHKRIHTNKRFKCTYCGERFVHESDMNDHKRAHNIKKMKFKCLKCPKQFNLVTERNEHLISHHKVKLINCDQCDYVAVKMYLMKVHMRTHSGEKPFECAICPKTFRHLSSFKNHVRTHTGDKRYSCSYCDLRFVQRKGMIVHENKHHPEEAKLSRILNS